MSKPEHYSLPQTDELAQWLGGIFEIGGTISFNRQTRIVGEEKQEIATPFLQLANSNQRTLEIIKQILHLNAITIQSSRDEGSKKFRVVSTKAVKLGSVIKPYSASREIVLEYFEWWKNASTTQERFQAGSAFLNLTDKDAIVPVETYRELLQYPAFVAGLLDLRANIYLINANTTSTLGVPKVYPRKVLSLNSKKIHLLNALHTKYLGAKPYPASGGTYSWKLEESDAVALLTELKPYLHVLTSFDNPHY